MMLYVWLDVEHHRLTNTVHLTLKMTSAQVVETSVTNNSFFQNYPHPDDHSIRSSVTILFPVSFKPRYYFQSFNIVEIFWMQRPISRKKQNVLVLIAISRFIQFKGNFVLEFASVQVLASHSFSIFLRDWNNYHPQFLLSIVNYCWNFDDRKFTFSFHFQVRCEVIPRKIDVTPSGSARVRYGEL